MSLASSLDKNKITSAIASGVGHLLKSAFGIARRFAAVSMMLGRTELARTPVPFKSAARESIIATAAALDATYAAAPAAWFTAACDAILMITPLPCFSIAGAVVRASRN